MNIRIEAVAENIRREREKRNLSISGLAERADLSASCISKAEMARSGVSLKTLIKIAAALEVPVGELLEEAGEKQKKDSETKQKISRHRNLFEQIMESLPEETADVFLEMIKELIWELKKERKEKISDTKQEGR